MTDTKGAPCPICSKPAVAAFNPFCCKRCSDVDLGRWLNGSYQIPGEPAGEEDLAAAQRPRSARPSRLGEND